MEQPVESEAEPVNNCTSASDESRAVNQKQSENGELMLSSFVKNFLKTKFKKDLFTFKQFTSSCNVLESLKKKTHCKSLENKNKAGNGS